MNQLLLMAGTVALLLDQCSSGQQSSTTSSSAQPTSYTAHLTAQNGSGETGTVTLSPLSAGSTTVAIALNGAPAGSSQPAHVHPGSCANLDPAPKWSLNNVVNGASTTTLDVPVQTLLSGAYAVNVHQSAANIKVYVACADLTGATANP